MPARGLATLLLAVATLAPSAAVRAGDPEVGSLGSVLALDIRRGRVLELAPDGGSLRELVVAHSRGPDGIAVDLEHGHIYWTNMGRASAADGFILRADLDGGNVVGVVPPGATHTPKQLKIDDVGGKLYWADREGMRLMRADLDGSHVETLVTIASGETARSDPANHAVGIALDPEHGELYWSQKGPESGGRGSIRRAGMNVPLGETAQTRSDIQVLFDLLPEPIDLEIDVRQRLLYWTDRGDNTVNRAPLDPPRGFDPAARTDRRILARGLGEAIGLALDSQAGVLYVSNLEGSLLRVGLDGSPPVELFRVRGAALTGLARIATATAR